MARPQVYSGNCAIRDDGTPVCIYSNGAPRGAKHARKGTIARECALPRLRFEANEMQGFLCTPTQFSEFPESPISASRLHTRVAR